LLDRVTVAALLKVSARTLDSWHQRHVGPPRMKLGHQVRYSEKSLIDWLRSNEKPAS
jgi:DNA-binding transcriptional MerR regulator